MPETQDPSGQRVIDDTMRPNIRISHTLNGRVKDYAAEEEVPVPEAYRRVIEAGLAELEGDEKRVEHTPDDGQPDPERDAPDDDLAAAIDAWVPDGDVATQTARQALRDAVAFLDAYEGRATKSDIVGAAKPADVSEQQWWDRGAQPGLAMLAEEGLVSRPTSKTYAMEE